MKRILYCAWISCIRNVSSGIVAANTTGATNGITPEIPSHSTDLGIVFESLISFVVKGCDGLVESALNEEMFLKFEICL